MDDRFFRGAITELRSALELGVRVVTGDRAFTIFQDVDGIELGQQWRERLEDALSEAKFLLPVVTPLFFTSENCREELGRFMEYERSSGRDDLILPIYFVTTPALEKADQLAADPLAQEISKRQRRDWRAAAELPPDDPKLLHEVKSLAEQVARVLERTEESRGVQPSPKLGEGRERELKEGLESIGAHAARGRGASRPKAVLWVDDNPDNNVWERAAMERYDVEFILARSTEEALSKLSDGGVDAIISDMGRPPDTRAGYTLLRAVRSRGVRVPYFIYAGSRVPEHVEEARRQGAQGTTNLAAELIQMVVGALRAGAP